jgi:hypothetical protein
MLVALETLLAAERIAFVLHDAVPSMRSHAAGRAASSEERQRAVIIWSPRWRFTLWWMRGLPASSSTARRGQLVHPGRRPPNTGVSLGLLVFRQVLETMAEAATNLVAVVLVTPVTEGVLLTRRRTSSTTWVATGPPGRVEYGDRVTHVVTGRVARNGSNAACQVETGQRVVGATTAGLGVSLHQQSRH